MPAQEHMHITDELFTERSRLLAEFLREAGGPEAAAKEWLERDGVFRTRLVKVTRADCEKRYNTDQIHDYPRPRGRATGRER